MWLFFQRIYPVILPKAITICKYQGGSCPPNYNINVDSTFTERKQYFWPNAKLVLREWKEHECQHSMRVCILTTLLRGLAPSFAELLPLVLSCSPTNGHSNVCPASCTASWEDHVATLYSMPCNALNTCRLLLFQKKCRLWTINYY